MATLTRAQIAAFCNTVHQLAVGADHRACKTNAMWLNFYSLEYQPQVMYVSPTDGTSRYVSEPMMACRQCGIVIPLKVISIDHQGPQTGGEAKAICRVFRSLGLTITGGKGKKSRSPAAAAMTAAVGGLPSTGLQEKKYRYTLNRVGEIYFTMAYKANILSNERGLFMNSILNLRPTCPHCNSSLRNSGAY